MVAACSDNTSGAKKLGNFDGQPAGHSGGAEDKDVFARRELCAIGKREPSGDAGVGEGGGDFVIEAFGDGKGKGCAHNGALGHRAVRWARSAEEDALAVGEMPDSIGAADDGKLARAGIVRAASELFVDRLQCGGVNVHEDLALSGHRFGEFFVAGRLAKRVEDGGVHGS